MKNEEERKEKKKSEKINLEDNYAEMLKTRKNTQNKVFNNSLLWILDFIRLICHGFFLQSSRG